VFLGRVQSGIAENEVRREKEDGKSMMSHAVYDTIDKSKRKENKRLRLLVASELRSQITAMR